MRVRWSTEAILAIADVQDYIAKDKPGIARRVVLQIVDMVGNDLLTNPELGHPGRVPGTRELVIPKTPFIVPYRIRANVLEVLGVYHHARRWSERL